MRKAIGLSDFKSTLESTQQVRPEWRMSMNGFCSATYSICTELHRLDTILNIRAREINEPDAMLVAPSLVDFSSAFGEKQMYERVNTLINLCLYIQQKMKKFIVQMPNCTQIQIDKAKEIVYCSFDCLSNTKLNNADPKFITNFIDTHIPSDEVKYELRQALANTEQPDVMPRKYVVPALFAPISNYVHSTPSAPFVNLGNHTCEMTKLDTVRFYWNDVDPSLPIHNALKANMPFIAHMSQESVKYYDGFIQALSLGFLKLLALLYAFDTDTTRLNIAWILNILKANINFFQMDAQLAKESIMFPIVPPQMESSVFTFSTELTHQLHLINREIHYGLAFRPAAEKIITKIVADITRVLEDDTEDDVPQISSQAQSQSKPASIASKSSTSNTNVSDNRKLPSAPASVNTSTIVTSSSAKDITITKSVTRIEEMELGNDGKYDNNIVDNSRSFDAEKRAHDAAQRQAEMPAPPPPQTAKYDNSDDEMEPASLWE